MRFQLAYFALAAFSTISAAPIPRGIFDKTETITSTQFINVPVAQTIAALHDFPLMINLNPLVTSSVADPADPTKFTIADSLPLFLGLSLPASYESKFKAVADGMNTDTEAGAGVKLRNEWRVVEGANGGTELTETDFVTSNRLLSPFIASQIKASHDKLMQTLTAQLESAAGVV